MYNKNSTKNKILKFTLREIQMKSYNSFSLQDVANASNLKKASILYHFDSKHVLGVEAIRNFKSKVCYLIDKMNREINDPWEKLDQYFEFHAKGLKDGLICPATAVTTEINTLPKEMKEEMVELFNNYMDWLSKLLDEGRKSGHFSFDENPTDLAFYFSSSISGAVTFARAFKDKSKFYMIMDKLKDSIRVS